MMICPCCGIELSTRQVRRHLRLAQLGLQAALAEPNLGPNNDVDVAGGDLGVEGGIEKPVEPAINAMDLDNPDLDQDAEAPLNPANGLLRNPPVAIQNWPEPEPEPEASDDEDEYADDLPLGHPERDPEFVEEEFQP
ncbi:hypothetical protein FRC06_005994, partial [Ceratobasidium sp. 370]